MPFENRTRYPSIRRGAVVLPASLALALPLMAGCGHKDPPQPPIPIVPSRTVDLKLQQRGSELLLSFTYPTTTIAGTALGDIQAVEFWELVRDVPRLGEPPAEGEDEAEPLEGDETGEEREAPSEGEPETEEPQEREEDRAEEAGEAETEEAETEEADAEEPAAAPAVPQPGGPPVTPETMVQIEPMEFYLAARIRLTLRGPELEAAISGNTVRVRFPMEEPPESEERQTHIFAIKTLSYKGRASGFSNLVWLVPRETPEPPTDFEVEPEAQGIELRWFFAGKGPAEEVAATAVETAEPGTEPERVPIAEEPPVGEAEEPPVGEAEEPPVGEAEEPTIRYQGFHVYRRDAQARSYGPPLQRLLPGMRTFVDRTASYGQRYIYAVTAIIETAPPVETSLSAEREVDYDDRFAPPPPANPVVLAERGSVRLLWDASRAPDVLGYYVERRTGEAEFTVLNLEPIEELEYTDTDVVSGRVYFYRVSAVDQLGNRGVPGRTVDTRVP